MNDPNNVVDIEGKIANGTLRIRPRAIIGNLVPPVADSTPSISQLAFFSIVAGAVIWAVLFSSFFYWLIVFLWDKSPGTGPSPATPASEGLGLDLVGILGAIGGFVRCLHTFNRCFSKDESLFAWAVSTFLTPLKSALLALIVALIIKAGLINGNSSVNSTNWLGIYAISALVGLFANEAISKLEEVFKTIFGITQKPQPQNPPNQPPASK